MVSQDLSGQGDLREADCARRLGKFRGGAAIAHVSLWIACMLLGGGFATDTALRLRDLMKRPPA